MRWIRIPPTPGTVIASIALLVALGGTSIAAVEATVPNNSVGTAQLKNNAVTNAKVAANAVTAAKLAANSVTSAKIAGNAVTSAKIASGAVTNSDLAANAVTSAKVAPGSLLASDFAAGQIPAGPTGPAGPAGPTGPTGPAGASATSLWAVVNANGTLARSKGVIGVSHTSTGGYRVQFNANITACAWLATIGSAGPGTNFGFIEVELSSGSTDTVFVGTLGTGAAFADRGFHLAVFC